MSSVRTVGRVLSNVLVVLLAIMLCCNVYMIVARGVAGVEYPTVFGYYPAIVISGSMSGSIEINDMVIIHQQEHYDVGDVVAYKTGNSLVTHRIVEKSDRGFTTKGDANNAADRKTVLPDQILGKVVLIIPKIGVFHEFMQTPLGMCSAVLVICFVIFIPGSHAIKKKNEQNERSFDYEG